MNKVKLFFLHTFAFAFRNYIFAKRNIFVLVEMLFWPVVAVLTIGLMGDFLKLDEKALSFVLTGAIASGVLQVTQLDVGYSLLYDLWSKSLKHTFLSPSGVTPALLGSWVIGIIRGSLVYMVLAFLSRIFFRFALPPPAAALEFLLGIFFMSLLAGMCVWILILTYGMRAEISVWALSYLIMILCGIYYPVEFLPRPFFALARCLPLTYFLDSVRVHYGFPSLFSHGRLIGWALNIFYLAAGIGCVRASLEKARRTGLMLRLSE